MVADADGPSPWVHVKVKRAVADRFQAVIERHPELGFDSLPDFLTKAGVREVERLEELLAGRAAPAPPPPPVRPSPLPERPTPEPEPEEVPRPSPPPAPSPSPSPVSQPSPGEASAEGPVGRKPRSKGGRSSRSTAAEAAKAEGPEAPGVPATPPDEAKPPAPPSAEATAAMIPAGSTWTCPDCHTTMSLVERAWHRPDCLARKSTAQVEGAAARGEGGKGDGSGAPSAPDASNAGPTQRPVASTSPAPRVDVDELVRFVRTFAKSAKDYTGDRLAYLAAAVQAGHRDQNVPVPSDAEARELVRALAARDPIIERALEKVVA